MPSDADLPEELSRIVADLAAVPVPDRLEMLVELGQTLPELPERYRSNPELLESVRECQSPVYVRAEVDGTDPQSVVHLHVSAPPHAPVTRGFAGILHAGLDGLTAREVLALPSDLTARLSLDQAVSPLRLRGMAGMLLRVQRQVAEATA